MKHLSRTMGFVLLTELWIHVQSTGMSGGRFTKLVISDKLQFLFQATEILASDWLSIDLSLIFVICH